ncbi:MAG: hypothetical protein R3F59_17250 [Myxococcota bacterium]
MSSAVVFMGYSIPGFALSTILLVLLGSGSASSTCSRSAASAPTTGRSCRPSARCSTAHHAFLPVLCYAAGSFATLTVLMKNS